MENGVTADGVAASGIAAGGAVVNGVAADGIAAGHTRDTAAPGKSMEERVLRVAGDVRARGGSVLGDRVGAAGARRKVLNIKDRTKVETRTPAKFSQPIPLLLTTSDLILPRRQA